MEGGPLDLCGTWRASEAAGDLHQRFVERDFDDSAWSDMAVPGHWRTAPPFSRSDGPVLYRRRFSARPPTVGRRHFLVFEGVFYYGDVWLDGAYLGATEGYFAPHAFEVTEHLAATDDHVVAVEVACPPEGDRTAKRMVTGVFSHWDNLDPAWNPGGLWRPVRLVETGPVRISRLRVLCTEATEDRGRLLLDLTVDAPDGPPTTRLRARLRGRGVDLDVDRAQTLAAGTNHLKWSLDVDRPPRWWPWRYGDQPLCDLHVAIEADGAVSDERHLRTAFREVRLDGWRLHLNGERLFVMGSNQGPARMALGEATARALGADVAAARDANLDMLRLHAHVSRSEVYAAADEAGVLLWQDLPLQWRYARGARKPAAAQAREAVDALGHHPSVVVWCGHNEPSAGSGRSGLGGVAAAALPSWNKDVLDRSVGRALSRADGTRPVVAHSGVLPGPLRDGTDSHLYHGWYTGGMADLAPALRRWPKRARFVSEFGAQAVPEAAAFMEPERWPHLDWPRLTGRHSLQKRVFDRVVPPDAYDSFDSWRAATQAYQAALIQLQGEDLRRLRHRPTAGFLQFSFADGYPGVTWSVLDAERRPKAGLAALRDTCRTVLPMLDPRTGQVHVANEGRRPLGGAVVTATWGEQSWGWEGDLPADSLTYVGTVDVTAEVSEATVTLTHPETADVTNRYGPVLLASTRPPAPVL